MGSEGESLALVHEFVADCCKHWGRVVARATVSRARGGCSHGKDVRPTTWTTPLAHIAGLRTERDGIDLCPIGREQPDRFSRFVQLKVDVEIRRVRAVLAGFVVRPNQEITPRRDAVAGG